MHIPVNKMQRWMACLHKSIGHLDGKLTAAVMKRSGESCGADLMALCEKQFEGKVGSVRDLVMAWNELRSQRNLGGRWAIKENIVTAVFTECGCPLVRSGLIELHPVQCYCSQSMMETIFSQLSQGTVEVQIKRSIGRGDSVCEFLIKT